MRVAFIISSLTLLGACATTPQASASLTSGLNAIIGQPVEVAVARLGVPIAAVPTGAGTVYGWGRAFTSTEALHPNGGFLEANAQGGVFPPPRGTVENSCVIRMIVGADGRVRDWDVRGDQRACRTYADRLSGKAVARLD